MELVGDVQVDTITWPMFLSQKMFRYLVLSFTKDGNSCSRKIKGDYS